MNQKSSAQTPKSVRWVLTSDKQLYHGIGIPPDPDHARTCRTCALRHLASRFDGTEKLMFTKLRKAVENYATQSAGGEIDRRGTMRVAFIVARQEELLSRFTTLVFTLEDRCAPEPGVGFAEADARLNAIYEDIMAAPFHYADAPGGIKPGGIREAEQAWIAYRNAWVSFAVARYPWLDTRVLMAHLTRERTAFLEQLQRMVE